MCTYLRDTTLAGSSRVVGKDPYQLRIAGLNSDDKKWKLISASISAADQSAGVKIVPQPDRDAEEGWLRVDIESDTTRVVNWSLRFGAE